MLWCKNSTCCIHLDEDLLSLDVVAKTKTKCNHNYLQLGFVKRLNNAIQQQTNDATTAKSGRQNPSGLVLGHGCRGTRLLVLGISTTSPGPECLGTMATMMRTSRPSMCMARHSISVPFVPLPWSTDACHPPPPRKHGRGPKSQGKTAVQPHCSLRFAHCRRGRIEAGEGGVWADPRPLMRKGRGADHGTHPSK